MIISQSAEIDEEKAQTEEFKNPEIRNNPKAENQETKIRLSRWRQTLMTAVEKFWDLSWSV